MATDPETTESTPVPAPSAGVIARLLAAAGIKPAAEAPSADTVLIEGLRQEIADLSEAAGVATVKLEGLQASLDQANQALAAEKAKTAAAESAVPGISSAKDIKAHLAAHVSAQVAESISASGFKPGEAPGVEASGDAGPKSVTRDEFDQMTVPEQNAHIRGGGKVK